MLTDYETVLADAVDAGVDVVEQNYTTNWDFIGSVFFTTTILTTIGYVASFLHKGVYCNLEMKSMSWSRKIQRKIPKILSEVFVHVFAIQMNMS